MKIQPRSMFGLLLGGAAMITVVAKLTLLSSEILVVQQESYQDKRNFLDSIRTLRGRLDTLSGLMPGLGEFMSSIQLHSSKLWYASRVKNRGLAKFELNELDEAMAAAQGLHARSGNVDITQVLQAVSNTQLKSVAAAVDSPAMAGFAGAYDDMITACNGCHRESGHEFIHISRPHREPVANQVWQTVGTEN